MPTLNQDIQFKFGLQANYTAITEKDPSTIYFTTDKQRMYVGDVEVTRPVAHGTTLPTSMLPPDSLFVLEADGARRLHYSKDGATWELIAVLPKTITGGVFGDNTAGDVAAGGSLKLPKLTVDEHGFITAVENVEVTLPDDVANTVIIDGDGNAVTGAEWDAAGHQLTLTKGVTYATKAELTSTIAGLTKLDFVVLGASEELPETGIKGTIYLKPHTHGEGDSYDEFIWVNDTYEKIGNTDIDLSGYVPNTRTINGQALTEDIVITSVSGNAGTATKLATARKLNVGGALTGTAANFDGSKDVTIEVTAVAGEKVTGAVPLATKATQDEDGNNLKETYQTITAHTEAINQLEQKITQAQAAATLKWGTF